MIKSEDKIIVFTDGASKGNPGSGGFGAIVIKLKVSKVESIEGNVLELGGGEEHTTNNRMELSGAINAFEKIKKEKEDVIVYTDSKYLINGITGWIFGWQKNNWQKKKVLADGTIEFSDVLNQDLWKKLVDLTKGKKITWQYVGGHVGIAGNERCDEIADALATGQKVTLYKGPLAKYKINIMDLGHSEQKKEIKSNKGTKAYSYLSLVDGVLNIDKTWAECEKRVKGKKGVKFQKAISKYHEEEIIKNWGINE